MNLLEWFFSKHERETELKEVQSLKKETGRLIRILNKIYGLFELKRPLMNNSSRIEWGAINEINSKLIWQIKSLVNLDRRSELFCKHILRLSATKLHLGAEELGIRALKDSYRINHIEEAKRRSFLLIKTGDQHATLISKLASDFDKADQVWMTYLENLAGQRAATKS